MPQLIQIREAFLNNSRQYFSATETMSSNCCCVIDNSSLRTDGETSQTAGNMDD